MLQRVVDYCDGWLPIGARAANVLESVQTLRQKAEKAGRDPHTVALTIFGCPADAQAVEQYRQAGASRVTFGLPSKGRDAILPLLDRYAEFMRALR
jgi:alkanesulfonate monooxygenase SsuD/methylene tetrahydromethanopterin reductase-like flavin-dependent oxidoreductase (luciferase family)